MTNEELKKRLEKREERRKKRKPGLCFSISDCVKSKEANAYRMIGYTYGLETDFGHPELEALINFNPAGYDHSVISEIGNRIRKGESFRAGERVTIHTTGFPPVEVTAEIRVSPDDPGRLRIVFPGFEEAFQNLSLKEAEKAIAEDPAVFEPSLSPFPADFSEEDFWVDDSGEESPK